VIAGIFLGKDPELWKFCVVLGGVAILQLLRTPCVARMPAPPASVMESESWSWREDVRYIFGRRDILIFCGYFMLLMFLAGFLVQPLVLYMKHLGFSTRDNTLIYAASVLGSVLALVLAGIIVDRVGTRRVFLGVHIVLSVLALMIVVVGELTMAYARPFMMVLQIMAGAALAVAVLTNTTQIFHMAPPSAKVVYMSIMVSVSMLGRSFSPLLAGMILDSRWYRVSLTLGTITLDVFQLLFLGVGLGLLLAMIILPFIRNVRPGCRSTHMA